MTLRQRNVFASTMCGILLAWGVSISTFIAIATNANPALGAPVRCDGNQTCNINCRRVGPSGCSTASTCRPAVILVCDCICSDVNSIFGCNCETGL